MTRVRVHPPHDLVLAEATFCAIDSETTGMEPRRDRVVALGAVRFGSDGQVTAELGVLVDPEIPIPATATAIHGITDADVRGRPRLEDALPGFRGFIADAIPVAHMGAFDLAFLRGPLRAARLPSLERMLDTAVLAERLAGPLPDTSLEALCARFGLSPAGRHTALGDARIAASIMSRLLPLLRHRGARTLGEALDWGDVGRGVRP